MRLTERNAEGVITIFTHDLINCIPRLAEYEETGLEPGQIKELLAEHHKTADSAVSAKCASWAIDLVRNGNGLFLDHIEAHCTKCGYEVSFKKGWYNWRFGEKIPFRYCPGCGAKMDGKDGDKNG